METGFEKYLSIREDEPEAYSDELSVAYRRFRLRLHNGVRRSSLTVCQAQLVAEMRADARRLTRIDNPEAQAVAERLVYFAAWITSVM